VARVEEEALDRALAGCVSWWDQAELERWNLVWGNRLGRFLGSIHAIVTSEAN
jgi:hypothetical protein